MKIKAQTLSGKIVDATLLLKPYQDFATWEHAIDCISGEKIGWCKRIKQEPEQKMFSFSEEPLFLFWS